MSVAFVVNKLSAANIYSQVIAAPVSVGKPTLDTAKALKTLLRSTFSGSSFDPLTLGANPVHPSLVYQLVSSGWLRQQGYAVAFTETYVLTIRAADLPVLISKVDSIIAKIQTSTDAIEITDMLTDYDDVQKLYRSHIEIDYTQPAGNGSLAAALVLPISIDASADVYDSYCSQRRTNSYAVISLDKNDLSALRDSAESALVTQQEGTQYSPLQLKSGGPLVLSGGMYGWQDIYIDSQYTTN